MAEAAGMREIFLFQRDEVSHWGSHSWPGSAGSGSQALPPTQCPFHPLQLLPLSVVIMRVLDTGPQGGPPTHGNSRTSLELRDQCCLDLTDLSHLSLTVDMKPVLRHVPYSSLWPRANHPPTCLPLEGLPALEPKASLAELSSRSRVWDTILEGFPVLPESQNVVMRPLALRLKESPKWPRSSSGSWRLVQWAEHLRSAVTPAVPGMMGQAQL